MGYSSRRRRKRITTRVQLALAFTLIGLFICWGYLQLQVPVQDELPGHEVWEGVRASHAARSGDTAPPVMTQDQAVASPHEGEEEAKEPPVSGSALFEKVREQLGPVAAPVSEPAELAGLISDISGHGRYLAAELERVEPEPIDWTDLKDYRYGGEGWVRGCWFRDYRYSRGELLQWLDRRVAEQESFAGCARDLRSALLLAMDHDPLLARHLALWDVAFAGKNRLSHSLLRLALCMRRTSDEEAFQEFWQAPLAWIPKRDDCLAITGLPNLADRLSEVAGAVWQAPLLQRFGAEVQQEVRSLLQRHEHLFLTADQLLSSSFADVDDVGAMGEELEERFAVFGRYSTLVTDGWLRMLEQCDRYVPLGRPQDQLYLSTTIIRRYGDTAQVRVLPMLLGMQQDGLANTGGGSVMYHDRFNAMEAAIYARYGLDKKTFRDHPHKTRIANILQAMARRTVAIAFNEDDHEHFHATFTHRWMALDSMLCINRSLDRYEDNQQWHCFLLDPENDIPKHYRARARRELAQLYHHLDRYDEAIALYRKMVLETWEFENEAVALIGMLRIAQTTRDHDLYQEAIELAKMKQREFLDAPEERRRGSAGFTPLIEWPWPYETGSTESP